MTARPQTTFAPSPANGTAANPFGTAPAPKKRRKAATGVALDALAICNDPLPGRRVQVSKYAEKFAQMEPGQNLRCEPTHVATVAKALGHWLRDNKYPGTVRSQKKGDDGVGRVWWMASTPPQKRA